MLKKEDRILECVRRLTEKFGSEDIRMNDYWDADLCAIGFADKDHQYLIYISSYNRPENFFYVSVEGLSSKPDKSYEEIEHFENISYTELEDLILRYLIH